MKKNKLLEIVQTGYVANVVLIPTGDVIGKFQFHEYKVYDSCFIAI